MTIKTPAPSRHAHIAEVDAPRKVAVLLVDGFHAGSSRMYAYRKSGKPQFQDVNHVTRSDAELPDLMVETLFRSIRTGRP